jgi:hypothetical protein
MKIIHRTHRPTPWTACSIRKTTGAQHGYAAMPDFYLGNRGAILLLTRTPPTFDDDWDMPLQHLARSLLYCVMQHLTANSQNVNVICADQRNQAIGDWGIYALVDVHDR